MILAYDCECFGGFFCCCFSDGQTFTHTDLPALARFVSNKDLTLIGFNGFGYDDLLLKSIVINPQITVKELNEISQRIVTSERMPQDLFKLQYANYPWKQSICMYNITNKKCSLKEWACRIHFKTVQDSSVDFLKPLDPKDYRRTIDYCKNDVAATWALYEQHKHLVALREQIMATYAVGNRVMVQGDAGVTKTLAMDSYKRNTGGWSSTAREAAAASPDNRAREWPTTIIISPRVKFKTDAFRRFFSKFMEQTLVGDQQGTTWGYKDDVYDEPVRLGGCEYQIGVGGLHSVDAPGRFAATTEVGIYDLDVASYYPSLIITQNLYPKHIGPQAVVDYKAIRDARIAAKRAGDKKRADMYKLNLNSYFGVLNEAHSPIRSIPCALKVTINGQLQLLMLIERLETLGVRVLSANTDGVTIMWHRDRLAEIAAVKVAWEKDTGHELEQAEYSKYARRDVNNYVALSPEGKIKTKGAFEQNPIGGKTDERIVKQAAQDWLLFGKSIAETVNASQNITDFIYYQRVKNGGDLYHGDVLIGRTARWYVGKGGQTIRRKNPKKEGKLESFATIPNGRNAVLAMTLPDDIPKDLDRSYYIQQARELCESITKGDR